MKMPRFYRAGLARIARATVKDRYCRTLLLLFLALPHTISAAPVFAQAPESTSPQSRAHRRRARLNVDDRVKVLAKALDLNETQQSAVKRILEQRQLETLRLRQDSSISGSARIDQFRALQLRTVEKIRAVLNDEQRKKYDPLASDKVQHQPERSVEDWLKLTTPH
jgi:Spy/CpxP family protein refolding chaperone